MVTKKRGPSRVIDKKLKSIHYNPIKTGHVQREFHGMPAGRHETLAVICRFLFPKPIEKSLIYVGNISPNH